MLQTILWLVITQSVFLAGSTQSSLVHNVTVQIICILSPLPPPCPNFHITPASPVLPPAPVWQVRLKPSCPWSWFICTALQGWQDAYTHTHTKWGFPPQNHIPFSPSPCGGAASPAHLNEREAGYPKPRKGVTQRYVLE